MTKRFILPLMLGIMALHHLAFHLAVQHKADGHHFFSSDRFAARAARTLSGVMGREKTLIP